jgi:vitamin B12 transporter
MRALCLAGLAGLATLGAQAQLSATDPVQPLQSVLVTATRALQPTATLRDTVVLTRDDIEGAGALSLGELLERRAGVQLRAAGGPGQPQGLFIRGAGTAQTLVLVDGLRVSSATVGTTSIENIPLELIERIEIVKGPLSSLYGSDAIGGVVQIFTRGKPVPHLFGSAAYGTNNDRRLAAGIATADERSNLSVSLGGRKVDAPSATNPRVAFCHDPDDDPHENGFANLHASHRMWQDEVIAVDAFAMRGRTSFDGCGSSDRNDQTLAGARLTSSNNFASWWASRVAVGHGRDRLDIRGAFPARFETRQDQASWINELRVPAGTLTAGAELLRQSIRADESQGFFARTRRETKSGFLGLNESWHGQRLEASVRHDDDDSFGKRSTGSASYGFEWPDLARLSATYARGFRAPTFFDLFGPASDFYHPNPLLQPERSTSREVALRAPAGSRQQWRLAAFDNRVSDLIVYVPSLATVQNVQRARVRGVEGAWEGAWLQARWRASFTAQRARDEDSGVRLTGRAQRFATVEASRSFGRWSAAVGVHYMGDREEPAFAGRSVLPAYTLLDARVRYRFEKFWSVELAATNLTDRRYESALGYDAPRRGMLLSLRFDAS